jgi:PAS domain S-box-containing protein
MSPEQFFYLAPYAISVAVLTGIFLFAVRERYIRGAHPFSWTVGGQLLATVAFILELVSPELEAKIFWDTVQWLTTAFLIILPFLVFATQVSEYGRRLAALRWVVVLISEAVFAAVLLTNSTGGLFYSNPRLAPDQAFPQLQYDLAVVAYLYILLYVYGANVYGTSLLIWRAFQPHNLLRGKDLLIAAGFLMPLIAFSLALTNVRIAPQRDLTPVAYALGSGIAALGLFRYGLFDIAPIAHRQIVENLSEPVIVLDSQDRIIDVNQAALTWFGRPRRDLTGKSLSIAAAGWPFLLELARQPFEQRKEISLTRNGKTQLFDTTLSHIQGRYGEKVGRVITMRDVTRIKTLESDHQAIWREVEQRIQVRTRDLSTAAERYRSLVENIPDFIVRWKPDGTRTFVNEAYCRYWGISHEQALARNFLFHTPEEDRPDIENKIVRLNAGNVEIESGIYRAIRPDGTEAWHEWRDAAIRDSGGKLIEIHSVGRDITDRRQNEEKLTS